MGMSNLRQGFEIGNSILWIANALHEKKLGFLINQGSKVLGVIGGDKATFNPQLRGEDFELMVRAPMDCRRRDDVISDAGKCHQGHRDGGRPRCNRTRGHGPLESRHAVLEHTHRGLGVGYLVSQPNVTIGAGACSYVGNAAVDVAELANVQETHSMLGIVEGKCGSGVYGNRTAV